MQSKLLLLALLALLITGCQRTPKPDPAQPVPGVRTFDTTIHSTILGRDMPLRIALPEHIAPGAKLPVVFLLHGYASNYSSFSAWCPGDKLALGGFILVMPEDLSGFYLNQVSPRAHYEDYLVDEVVPAISKLVPEAATDAAHRGIAGYSRGGLGAVVIALHHPGIFSYAGALDAALDIADRPFIWSELRESISTQRALGTRGSPTRRANDPFSLLAATSSAHAPFIYVSWSVDGDLAPISGQFVEALQARHFAHSINITHGPHGWQTMAAMLPSLEASLNEHLGAKHP